MRIFVPNFGQNMADASFKPLTVLTIHFYILLNYSTSGSQIPGDCRTIFEILKNTYETNNIITVQNF